MLRISIFALPIILVALSFLIKKLRGIDMLIFGHAVANLAFALPLYLNLSEGGVIDKIGLFAFLITAVIYLFVALYSLGDPPKRTLKAHRLYSIFLMLFIAAMNAAFMARDLSLIWIFVEATTIFSALLISIENNQKTIAAAWKYLFICSVGIALAFVGILLFVLAQPADATLKFEMVNAAVLSPFWLKLSFVFVLIGFGTKIGLAPMHFWLPDAYTHAPSPISALLSGALMNAALLPLLRMEKIMQLARLGHIAQDMYLIMGFLSVFVAAVFMMKTTDFKRILAFSSIENKGLIMIAFGLGGSAIGAGYMHILGHSLIKAALFLVGGNIVSLYGTSDSCQIGGLLSKNRNTAWIWLIGIFLILGFPPSPIFISKFFIFAALLGKSYLIPFFALIILLAFIAYRMTSLSLTLCAGELKAKKKLNLLRYLSPALLLLIAAIIGIVGI